MRRRMMSRIIVTQNQNEEEGSDKFRKVENVTYVMFRLPYNILKMYSYF